ncbi:cytochrome P450 [Trametes coccinea BRFM310]|uniref:Cytochrome P450 n=1 Tax=Trametes coccinea (strain BRFM310) TaxID=1353009 RepID=A0A1Y2IR54_TRAC3|nr:cytochrome P450 [Trametes coccinea BRFM310]
MEGTTLTVAVALLLVILASRYVLGRSRRASLPPGPPQRPIIGNLLDLPAEEMWRKIWEWGKQYGDVIYLRMFGTPFIFLNSAEAVMDLLHKRGAIYSDRPHHTMACDLCELHDLVPLTKYNEKFKFERRLMNQALGFSAVEKWQPLVTAETHLLLLHLLRSPDTFVQDFRRYAGSLIFSTIYGYHVEGIDDPYVKASEELMEVSSWAMMGGWAVDSMPWLKYIPGLGFHKFAAKCRAGLNEWVEKPHHMFKDLPDSMAKRLSFCGNLLLNDDGKVTCEPEYEHKVKWLAVSVYGPGSDTTVITLSILFLALCHHPEVLQKAQKQLDEVVGPDRLPTFQDRSRLPYIDCLLKEVLRWGTPVPLTPVHRLMQEDQYRGYALPEGSYCIANMWAILHDEKMYPDPLAFSPERFERLQQDSMDADEKARLADPYNYAFGFGRRRCPGLHFADQSLFMAFASILACFDISPLTGADGKPLLPPLEFAGGAFRHPKPFKCRVSPRRPGVEGLIEGAMASAQ